MASQTTNGKLTLVKNIIQRLPKKLAVKDDFITNLVFFHQFMKARGM